MLNNLWKERMEVDMSGGLSSRFKKILHILSSIQDRQIIENISLIAFFKFFSEFSTGFESKHRHD